MGNSVSVRFYFDQVKANQQKKVVEEITKSAKNFGKLVESDYYEFKSEGHLLAHPYEYIPFEFQRMIRPFVTKVTLVTHNNNNYGLQTGHPEGGGSYRYSKSSRVPVQIGTTRISLDDDNIMMVGKNLDIMIKAYFLYCKYDGTMPDYEEPNARQREIELRKKYNDALLKIKELEQKLKNVSEKKKRFFSFN